MPACATVQTGSGEEAPPFGIPEEEAGLYTQSIKVNHKKDKKELRNRFGNVFAVAHYNKTSEVEIEGTVKANFSLDVGGAFTLANTINPVVVGKLNIDEISLDVSNEDFHKVSIKGIAYEKILV
jgi:hypothetical protein